MTQSDETPWYRDGLRFECTQCGACCSGPPGFVYVGSDEIEALAAQMQMDRDTFERRFVRRVGIRDALAEYPDGDCIFLDPQSRRCLVYAARPIQCRTWPFWDSNLASPSNWRETRLACPGAGTGKLYRLHEIEIRRREKSV